MRYLNRVVNDLQRTRLSRCRMNLLPLPLTSVSSTGAATHRKTGKGRQHADGRGGRGEANSYDCEKAWPSVNHSILSALRLLYLHVYIQLISWECLFNVNFWHAGQVRGAADVREHRVGDHHVHHGDCPRLFNYLPICQVRQAVRSRNFFHPLRYTGCRPPHPSPSSTRSDAR